MSQPAVTSNASICQLLLWSSLGSFLLFAVLQYIHGNLNLFLYLNQHLAVASSAPFWAMLTNLGDGFFLFPLVMVLFLRKPDQQLSVLLGMIILAMLCHFLKDWFAAPRPAAMLDHDYFTIIGPVLKTNSFPSGHAATATLLAGLSIIYFRSWISPLLVTLVLLVDLSRIVVGAHWPVDVIAGIWLGVFCAATGCWLALKVRAGIISRGLFIALGMVALVQLPVYDNGFQHYLSVKILAWAMALCAATATMVELAELYFERFPDSREKLLRFIRRQGRYLLQKLVCFGLVGSSGFLVDLCLYTLFCSLFGIPHLVSRGLSYWFAASWNWYWNRTLTFHDTHKSRKFPQWGKYLAMCMVSFVPNWGAYYLLTSWIPFFSEYPQLALIAGVAAGMLFNFSMAFMVVFAARLPTTALGKSDIES